MPQSSFNSAESDRRRWQFSIGGLLLFTASVAVGLSAMTIEKCCWFGSGEFDRERKDFADCIIACWPAGLLAMIFFWIGLGLLNQIRDLRRCLTTCSGLDREQKLGAKLEIAWRVALVAIFALYVANAVLMNQEFYVLHEEMAWPSAPGPWIREGLFGFLTLVIVGSVPRVCREPLSSPCRTFVSLAACLAAIVFCLMQWMNATWFGYADHLATFKYDKTFSNVYSIFDANRYPADAALFFWWSLATGAIVIVNGVLLERLAHQWSKSVGRRVLWLGWLITGIVFVSGYVFWIILHGLRNLSPYAAQAGYPSASHARVAAAIFLAVIVTTLAYRLTTDRATFSHENQICWRSSRNDYFGEWRLILLSLVIVLIASHCRDLYGGLELFGFFRGGASQALQLPDMRQLFVLFLSDPAALLWLAVVLTALHRAFCHWPDQSRYRAELPRVNLSQFATIWLATAAFTISASFALAWMSFGLWFSPWFGGR
jgi:hypothetical protein